MKKRTKQFLSLVLAACMLLGSTATAFASAGPAEGRAGTSLQNVALGKNVTGINPNKSTNAASVTDGNSVCTTSGNSYYEVGYGIAQNPENPYYIQVDLGDVYPVERVNLWRYYIETPRSYHDTIVFVSEDETFTAEDIVYNSDADNFFGLGAGTDKEYVETAEGKEITFAPKNARYIRVMNNGHTLYDQKGGHYVEIEAWAYAEKPALAMEHSDTPLDIPTFTAPGKVDGVTHPDIVKFDQPWNGYTYWMAVTPNQNGNSQFENPCLVASNDGQNWEVPKGIENPLTGVAEEPRHFHNCDTDMVYNEADDTLYLYYVWSKDSPAAGQTDFKPSEVRLIKISNDGTDFVVTEPIAVVTSAYRYDILSPSIVIGPDGIWRMYCVDTGDRGYNNQTNHVDFRTSEDGVNWSAPESLEKTFDQAGYQPWHVDVSYIPEKEEYWVFFPCYPDGGESGYTELFYAKSKDGKVWTTYEKPVMKPRAGMWDNNFIYRSTFLYDSASDMISLWYSAGSSQGWKAAYTENTYEAMVSQLGNPSTPDISEPGVAEWVEVPALGGDIVYGDDWLEQPNEGEKGIVVSYTKGAKATLSFYGTGIRWIGQKDINFGKAIVTLDGETTEVDTNGSAEWGLTHFEKTNLTPGVHTISIEAKEEGVFDKSGAVDIEKFVVQYDNSADIPASSVKMAASASKIYIGEKVTLTSLVSPFNATKKEIGYTSSDESVATVSDNGVVTGLKAGKVIITAAVEGMEVKDTIEITVKEFTVGELRMQIDEKHPLFLHHLYRQMFTELPGPLQGGKDIQGFWNSLKNKDANGKGISEDLLANQAIIIHASGDVKGDTQTLAWYEDHFEQTVEDQIPFFIMVSNSGTSSGGAYNPPSTEWLSKMYDRYPNMMGVVFSENHNATSAWEREARSVFMNEQVLLAVEKGGYVIYSDMNDNSDYVESVLNNQTLFDTLKQHKDNFILLAKTTSAWSRVSYNSHESVAQGAWMADIAGNWGSLIDSWMWFIEGFGPLYGDETFSVIGGVEECRGPVTFPELLFEMRMEQQARAGATVFTFEHPDYSTSVAKDNGKTNLFTPAFTESIVKAMEYMKEYDIPTKAEVLETTKVAYSAENGSLNDLAATVNLLNPLYGDKNHNGYNGGTMMVYFTGRYGTIPSLPKLATAEDKAQFTHVLTKDSVINELKDERGIKAFFDNVYPETYKGDGYAHFLNDTWLTYNTNWNIDSRVDTELSSEQNVRIALKNNNTSADITFNPYTILLVDDQKSGELKFRFNNYLVDKNEIWEGYSVQNTPHWNSDADTQMYNYLMNDYIPDSETQDDIYRKASITLSGLTKEPKLVMIKELINNDGSKQCAAPETSWNSETGEYTIMLNGNGWQEFKLTGVNDREEPAVDKTTLQKLIDEAQGYVDAGTVETMIETAKRIYLETLQKAKEVMKDETAAYEEVLDIQIKLSVCITTVSMQAGDKKALDMLLKNAAYYTDEVLKNYLDAGQEAFQAAREEAQGVYDDGDAFEADVKSAYDKLFEAMTALRMKPDKEALKALIDMVNALNPADYTEESFAPVKAALLSARAVYDDEQATEAEVKQAQAALKGAYDDLVKASTEEPDDGGKSDTDAPDDNSKPSGDGDNTPTGDTAPLASMAVLLLAAGAGLWALKRREK